jgi:LmbE family N-acetylglucosaminyl deacetylase
MRNKSILVVAAHPDDEVLGCGGTIAKHARAGDRVHILILAEGSTSRKGTRSKGLASSSAELRKLRDAARQAGKILGAAGVALEGLPDNRLDGLELLDVVKRIEKLIAVVRPSAVYTHHSGDVNIDHRIAHDAVIAAVRPQPGNPVSGLFFFETPSSTEWRPPNSAPGFLPTHFVDIAETLDLKMAALRAYSSEMRPWPHPRSYRAIEHLARWRGATVGREAAEAFETGRSIA